MFAIITAVFLVTAISLIYYPQTSVYLTDADLDCVINLLETKNIKLDKNIIPQTTSSMPEAIMACEYSSSEDIAKQLFGDDYTSEDGVCKKDDITIKISPQILIKSATPIFAEEFKGATQDNVVKRIKKILNTYNLNIKGSIFEVYDNKKGNGMSVVVTQTYEGFPVFNNSLVFEVSDKGISSVSGLYFIPSSKKGTLKPNSPIDALIKFASDPKNYGEHIVAIEQGYRLDTEEQNSHNTKLIPTWSILTDNGEVYFVNA